VFLPSVGFLNLVAMVKAEAHRVRRSDCHFEIAELALEFAGTGEKVAVLKSRLAKIAGYDFFAYLPRDSANLTLAVALFHGGDEEVSDQLVDPAW
jgi:hypothetical protein